MGEKKSDYNASNSREHPTELAQAITDAMELWDESVALGDEAAHLDPSLAEAIENNWTLAEFLGLYLARRPVAERMAFMGMERVVGSQAARQGRATWAEVR